MPLNVQTVDYGSARLQLRDNSLNSETRDLSFLIYKNGTTYETYPHGHIDGKNITLRLGKVVAISGTSNPYCAVAVLEDGADCGGAYADNFNNPRTDLGVVTYYRLGQLSTITTGDTFVLPLGDKAGTYRAVIIMADSEANLRSIANVDTAAASGQYCFSSEGYFAKGGTVVLDYMSGSDLARTVGWFGVNARVTQLTPSAATQGYTDTPTVNYALEPNNGKTGFVNPKQVKIGIRQNGGSIAKVVRATPNADGTGTTPTYNVDTSFTQAASSYDIVCGTNDSMGDTVTPDGEKPHIASLGTLSADFSNTTLSWVRINNASQVLEVVQGATGIGLFLRQTDTRTDVTVEGEFQFKGGSTNEQTQYVVRYMDSDNYYFSRATREASHEIAIYKQVAGVRTKLTSTPVTFSLNTWYKQVFTVNGTTSTLSVYNSDGTLLGSVSTVDSDLTGAGRYGIGSTGTTGCTTFHDNVRFVDPDTDVELLSETFNDGSFTDTLDYVNLGGNTTNTVKPSSNDVAGNALVEELNAVTIGHDVTVDASDASAPVVETNPLLNRGETYTRTFTFKNVYGNPITPSAMNLRVMHSTTQEYVHAVTGSPHTLTYTIPSNAVAVNGTTGTQYHLEVEFAHYGANDPTITYSTGNGLLYRVTRVLYISSTGNPAAIDNAVNCTSHASGVVNRGETVTVTYYLHYARGALYTPSSVYSKLRTADGTLENNVSVTPTNNLLTHTYTISYTDPASYDTTGKAWRIAVNDTNGNDTGGASVGDSSPAFNVSNKLLIGSAANDRSVITNHEKYNRGESVNIQTSVYYADGRAYADYSGANGLTVKVHDGSPAAAGTETDAHSVDITLAGNTSAGTLTASYVIASNHPAANDLIGQDKHIRVSHKGNTSDDSLAEWTVSSVIRLHSAATGLDSPTGYYVPNHSVYNRGETATIDFWLVGIRNNEYKLNVSTRIEDVLDGDVEDSQSITHNGTKYTFTYDISLTDKATWDLTGRPKRLKVVFSNGNTAIASTSRHAVSRKWQVSTRADLIDGEILTGKAPTPPGDTCVTFNRGQDAYFNAYVYNVRGELLPNSTTVAWGVRTENGYETVTPEEDWTANSFDLTFGGTRSIVMCEHTKFRFGEGFNGSSTYAETTGGALQLTDLMSLTVVFHRNTTGIAETIVEHSGVGTGSNYNTLYGLRINTANRLVYYHESGTQTEQTATSLNTLSSGVHRISLHRTRENNNDFRVVVKVNGTEFINTTFNDAIKPSGGALGKLSIGRRVTGAEYLDGGVYEVRVWGATNQPTQAVIDTILNPDARGAVNYEMTPEGNEVGCWFFEHVYEDRLKNFMLETSAHFYGTAAIHSIDISAFPEGRSLVICSTNTNEVDQPTTGVGGVGNFLETSRTEFAVSKTYTVQTWTQKKTTRQASMDTVFTIGEDVVYTWVNVLDANGDPVSAASVDINMYDEDDLLTTDRDSTTASDGWTSTVRFQAFAPASPDWYIKAIATHNGNTGTDSQMFSTISAFTANKSPVLLLGPVAGVPNVDGTVPIAGTGDVAVPGDRIIVGFAYFVSGKRTAVDNTPTPRFMLSTFNQTRAKAEILQADGTWKALGDVGYSENWFDFKQGIEPVTTGGTDYLEWIANFGTAAQGVTTGNGYVLNTSTWPKRQIVMVVDFSYNTQTFQDDERFMFGRRIMGDPRYKVIVGAGDSSLTGTHWSPGQSLLVGAALLKSGDVDEKTEHDITKATVSLHRFNTALGTTEYLDSDMTWKTGLSAYQWALSASAGDSKLALKQFTASETASWNHEDIFVVVRLIDTDGVPAVGSLQLTVVDTKFRHDRNESESAITFDSVNGHHHTGADGSRAIGDRS